MGYVVAPVLPFFSVRFEILVFLLFGAEPSLRCLELIGLPRGVLRSLLGFYCEEGVVHISDPMARCS